MTQEPGKVVRCPKCGGLRLQIRNDNTANDKLAKGAFWFGALGLLVNLFRTRNATRIYWECQNCGNKFPAE